MNGLKKSKAKTMNRAFCGFYAVILAMGIAHSAGIDVNPDRRGWHIEVRKISTDISSTSIRNQSAYADFSDSRVKSNSQFIILAAFNMGFDFYAPRYVVFNTITADYGRTILTSENGNRVDNTSIDRILISTDYTHRIWYIPSFAGGFEVGPYIKLNYQSGFDNPQQIMRFNSGAKLFDGVYLKDLHLNAFGEKDFSLIGNSENYGWESGLTLEYLFGERSKLYFYTNFRHYLYSSAPENYNPLYQLETELRLDSRLYKKLAIAPFIKYYALQGRHIPKVGSNLFIGFSFSFGYTFLDATKKREITNLPPTQNPL